MPKPPPPPPAIAYPPPPPPPPPAESAAPAAPAPPHKLSTATIATIGGGAVAVIGGIVALVTLLGGHDHKTPSADTPAPAVHSTPAPQPSSSTPGTVPSSAPSAAPSSAPSGPAQPASDTGGSAIDLGNGVVLVPAAGWSESGTADAGDADLLSPEQNTEFFVTTGTADSTDVISVLTTDIQTQLDNGSFSNLSLGDAEQGETGGSVFDRAAGVPFTATVSTQQGTTELSGTFGELLSSQSGFSAFVIVTALSDADLQSNTDAVNAMVDSLTGIAS